MRIKLSSLSQISKSFAKIENYIPLFSLDFLLCNLYLIFIKNLFMCSYGILFQVISISKLSLKIYTVNNDKYNSHKPKLFEILNNFKEFKGVLKSKV